MKNTYFKRISLLVVTIIFFFSCQNNDEVICEKIVLKGYTTYDYDDTIFYHSKSMINLIYQKGSILKQIYNNYLLPDQEDFVLEKSWLYPIRNIKLKKNTLNSFTFYIYDDDPDLSRIDLNKEVGTIFHSEYWNDATEEEKLRAGILFEAQIFDTIFNDILPVRKCNLYTLLTDLNPSETMEKWYFYYDVDRCIYVQAEIRNLKTGNLLNICKVEKVDNVSVEYFEQFWTEPPTENRLNPEICITGLW